MTPTPPARQPTGAPEPGGAYLWTPETAQGNSGPKLNVQSEEN